MTNKNSSIAYGAVAGEGGICSLVATAQYAIATNIDLQMKLSQIDLYQRIAEEVSPNTGTFLLMVAVTAGCFAGASATLSVYYATRQEKKE